VPQQSKILWTLPLCSLQEDFFNLSRRAVQLRVPNLLASDETSVNSLSERLANETLLHSADFNKVENRPQRAGEFEALRRLYVFVGQVGIMKYEDSGNTAVAAEMRRNRHVELRRTQIQQIVKPERRVVAVDTPSTTPSGSATTGPKGQDRADQSPETVRVGRYRPHQKVRSLDAAG